MHGLGPGLFHVRDILEALHEELNLSLEPATTILSNGAAADNNNSSSSGNNNTSNGRGVANAGNSNPADAISGDGGGALTSVADVAAALAASSHHAAAATTTTAGPAGIDNRNLKAAGATGLFSCASAETTTCAAAPPPQQYGIFAEGFCHLFKADAVQINKLQDFYQ